MQTYHNAIGQVRFVLEVQIVSIMTISDSTVSHIVHDYRQQVFLKR